MQASAYSQMARQFMELWQQQMSAVLNDREFVHSMVELMQAMGMSDVNKPADYAAGTSASATSHAAVPPDALLERLDQLEYRLRMLEKRMASLEAASRKPRAGAGAGKPAAAGKRTRARRAGKPAQRR